MHQEDGLDPRGFGVEILQNHRPAAAAFAGDRTLQLAVTGFKSESWARAPKKDRKTLRMGGWRVQEGSGGL